MPTPPRPRRADGRSVQDGDPGRRSASGKAPAPTGAEEVTWVQMILLVAAVVAVVVLVFTLLGYVLGSLLL